MPSPILARADALMQRRRQANGEVDDIPVLTDIVDEDEAGLQRHPSADNVPDTDPEDPPLAPTEDASPDLEPASAPPLLIDAGVRDILAHELARRVEQRLATELPRIIENTVRDFLAEQQMIETLQARD